MSTSELISIPFHARRIGLLAGAGRFPVYFAQQARQAGIEVHCAAVMGMASEELLDHCASVRWIGLARLGAAIRHFRNRSIKQAVMAGKIEKSVIFRPNRFWRLLPDWRTLHMWLSYARENKTDDTLLLAVIREFERDQIQFQSALDLCPELLVPHGFLTERKPTPAQWKDIRFGWELAKEMGRLDVGQTVIVKDTAVLAVEAIEGTDRAIVRAGELSRRGGFTVVKVAKPQQDMRFDVPTIGLKTIQTMHEAGGRVLAVEADKTIFLDESEVKTVADRLGIVIVSVHAAEMQLRAAS